MCRRVNFPIIFALALLLCLVWSTTSRADVPKPVGFWRFEGNTTDSGSGGNNGTLKGTAAIVTDAQRGKCLKLDGDGYMDIPSGVTELGDASFTIIAWIKTTKIGVPILSKSNGNTEWEYREKELYVADSDTSDADNDGTIEYVGHSCDWVRGETAFDDGQWHQIALTWDAGEEEGCVYVDGTLGTDDVGFEGGEDNDGDTVRIGFSESVHSSDNFTGLIDDVAIFDAALTAEQVVELRKLSGGDKIKVIKPTAEKDKPITLDTESHLVGWWKFDEVSGKTAADSSQYGRKGTLKGDLSFDNASVDGRTGKAIKLNGEDNIIEITGYKGISGTRPRTVTLWIKTTSSRGDIISWGSEDFGQMFIYRFIRGRLGITPHGGYYYINDPIHDDKWHHMAVVVVESELPNLHDDVRLYKDGTLAEIHDIGLLDLWPIETGKELNVTIGRRFKGLLDDVRIYDRPLSDDEIKAIFTLKSNRPLNKSR
ncbi:MAG: LamG domain-containing protein [Planctomycetota bacterium]